MTKFTVVWSDEAIDQLTQFWMQTTDRAKVTRTVDALEKALAYDPGSRGKDYFGERLFAISPIWVVFAVEPDDRLVTVLRMGGAGTGLVDYE